MAWSTWYVVGRWWPAQCRVDGCVERDGPGHATFRYGMWVLALTLSTVSVAATRPKFGATASRGAFITALAVTCFAFALGTLGEVFPPSRPPIYGY